MGNGTALRVRLLSADTDNDDTMHLHSPKKKYNGGVECECAERG